MQVPPSSCAIETTTPPPGMAGVELAFKVLREVPGIGSPGDVICCAEPVAATWPCAAPKGHLLLIDETGANAFTVKIKFIVKG